MAAHAQRTERLPSPRARSFARDLRRRTSSLGPVAWAPMLVAAALVVRQPRASVALAIPRDASTRPWRLQLQGLTQRLVACGIAG